GIGRDTTKEYLATFANFKIGDGEEIKNARLRIADLGEDSADMLVGADFFVSHRIFVANKEHRLYLSYNGGPVFNLSQNRAPPSQGGPEDQSNARTGDAKQADNSAMATDASAASPLHAADP